MKLDQTHASRKLNLNTVCICQFKEREISDKMSGTKLLTVAVKKITAEINKIPISLETVTKINQRVCNTIM